MWWTAERVGLPSWLCARHGWWSTALMSSVSLHLRQELPHPLLRRTRHTKGVPARRPGGAARDRPLSIVTITMEHASGGQHKLLLVPLVDESRTPEAEGKGVSPSPHAGETHTHAASQLRLAPRVLEGLKAT